MDVSQQEVPPSRNKQAKSARNHSESDGAQGSQVAHTLTACCRCRHRKTRCDPGLPRCTPCRKTNAVCDYFDASRGKKMPRAYVLHLQNKVRQLELELANPIDEPPAPYTFERVLRDGSFVEIEGSANEPRFLGPSSGIAMTRLVMDMAKNLYQAQSITEIVPEYKARQIRQRFAQEASKPTSKVYADISFVAAPNLPSLDLTERLVENFYLKAQYLYPVLHEPSFQEVVRDVYQGSSDPYKNFALRMVIAISMQKLDSMYAGLADSYYLAALPFLEKSLSARNLGSLQCLVLIALYSLTTPTRTAAFWIVALATRLCQDLRMTDEATVDRDETGEPLDAVESDLRRRLFWITLSMEHGLAHSLGRPCAFAFTHDHVDMAPFFMVDDKYIRPTGVVPGSPVSTKKRIALHFTRMRLLQLEIRRTLYLRKHATPADDSDPWFFQMEAKLNEWMEHCPKNDEGSGIGHFWFKARYNTMIVMLFRPTPQVPEPSVRAAQQCFEACKFNIHVQRQQISAKSVDLTWVFVQALFMAINGMLWSLSFQPIRQEYPKAEVDSYLETALEAIYLASMKWPGVESALELYIVLVEACRKAYGDVETSYNILSPPVKLESRSPTSTGAASALPSPSTSTGSILASNLSAIARRQSNSEHMVGERMTQFTSSSVIDAQMAPSTDHTTMRAAQASMDAAYPRGSNMTSGNHGFDPKSLSNPLPPPLACESVYNLFENMSGRGVYPNIFEEPFAHALNAGFNSHDTLEGLDLELQSELMNTLEADGIDSQVGEISPSQVLGSIIQ